MWGKGVAMIARLSVWAGTLAAAGLILTGAMLGPAPAQVPARIPFQIATGPTGGTYFPVGLALAGILSNPPGTYRCEVASRCGPPGLIVTSRTSAGAAANILAVNAGSTESALASADAVAEAVAGKGAFAKAGKQSHIRVIAGLFLEPLHLVVATKSPIKTVSGLRGQRVSLGVDGSGTLISARAVLAAYGLSERSIRPRFESPDANAQMMQKGELDAFFVIGGTPVPVVDDLIRRGQARLVPISGTGRTKLLARVPNMQESIIPANTYPGSAATPSVSIRAMWIVRDSVSADLVYSLTRALFSPDNRQALIQAHPATANMSLATASAKLPAPLHPGAARFYAQVKK
jgi:TRAP transporter TAXI family solute receptor